MHTVHVKETRQGKITTLEYGYFPENNTLPQAGLTPTTNMYTAYGADAVPTELPRELISWGGLIFKINNGAASLPC